MVGFIVAGFPATFYCAGVGGFNHPPQVVEMIGMTPPFDRNPSTLYFVLWFCHSIVRSNTGEFAMSKTKAKTTYKIVRNFMHCDNKVIKRGLTLAQAQTHCSDPETSSKTATSEEAVKLTRENGPWFDGYDPE